MLKLTATCGHYVDGQGYVYPPVYIPIRNISFVSVTAWGATRIHVGSDGMVDVKESPEEVARLIDELTGAPQ